MMYLLVRGISFLIRFWICQSTIEKYPIFANETLQWINSQILSIYVVLCIISYFITGNITSKFGIKSPTWKSVVYFFVYLPFIFLTYGILRLLTKLGVLPI